MKTIDEKMFECAACCKKLKTRKTLIRHVRICKFGEKQKFECASCHKKLEARKTFIFHVRNCKFGEANIKKVRQYECQWENCFRKFETPTGLLLHKRKEHNFIVIRSAKFQCKYCEKKFGSYTGYRKHMRLKHQNEIKTQTLNEVTESQSKQLFGCIYCDKKFTRKTNRKKHEAVCNQRQKSLSIKQNVPSKNTDLQHCASLPLQHEPDPSILFTPTQHTVLSETRLQTEYPFVSENKDKTLSTPSYMNSTCSPSLKRYLRDRPSFMKLCAPDVSSPLKALMNLKYGQDTVQKCMKKISSLQKDNRRLRARVETLEEQIIYMLEECV